MRSSSRVGKSFAEACWRTGISRFLFCGVKYFAAIQALAVLLMLVFGHEDRPGVSAELVGQQN